MELSRRDALAALTAVGTSGAAGCLASAPESDSDPADSPDTEELVDLYVAVGAVVYPSEVTGVGEFVRAFVPPRLDRADGGDAMRETAVEFEAVAQEWYGDGVAALSPADRDELLREVGADAVEEAPDGTLAQRVRFHVVNELLLALYSSPTGGELVGIENPQGHPGGTGTYQRGPGE